MGRAFWKSFRMFENLGPEVLDAVAAAARPRHWAAGETLFLRDDPGDFLLALVKGRIKLSVLTAQGRELILRQAEAGDLLGELVLFDEMPRSADATALEAVEGLVLGKTAFLALADVHPALYLGALRSVSMLLRETTATLESIALYPLEARVARFFLVTLKALHGDDPPEAPLLQLRQTQGDLAQLLGATRPKVNRVLRSFRETGVLVPVGTAMRCDLGALRRLAEPDV